MIEVSSWTVAELRLPPSNSDAPHLTGLGVGVWVPPPHSPGPSVWCGVGGGSPLDITALVFKVFPLPVWGGEIL